MATRLDQPVNMFMFMLNPRDKANLLIMTTRPTGVRSVFADFDATGLPQWTVVCKNLSENAKIAKLFYMADFMQMWYTTRAVSSGFRLAADAVWWETRRQLVVLRVQCVTSQALLTGLGYVPGTKEPNDVE